MGAALLSGFLPEVNEPPGSGGCTACVRHARAGSKKSLLTRTCEPGTANEGERRASFTETSIARAFAIIPFILFANARTRMSHDVKENLLYCE